MEFNLHIERLVLDDVNITPGQNDLFQASVINELTHLFNSGGLGSNFVSGASINRVAANSIQLNDGKPQTLGQQVAQSVYGGIKK